MLHLLAGLICIYAPTCVKVAYGQNEKGERFLCTAVPIDKDTSCPVQSLPVQSASVQESIKNEKETCIQKKLTELQITFSFFCLFNFSKQQQMRANISGASFPNELRNLLQRRLEDLENQLLKKVSELEEEKSQLYNETVAHRQRTDSTLNSLMNRISELEKGGAGFKSPENFKISLPLRTNYLFGQVKKSLPEMYAFTICMWLKSGSSPGIGTPFSYGVPGQANEIVLIEWGHNPIELLINDKVAQLPLSLSDGRWHHICITWTTRDGLWEAYQDGQRLGSGENLAPWHPIKQGGVLILGQEQDVVGGRFDATQAFVGELSHFNIWDRVLRSTDIIAMSNCSSYMPGNVVAWTDSNIEVFGGASKSPLELCEDRLFDN
uniref:Neuronal pentraxin-2-like n=1 Tax=Sinocyclocheilus grahami TaxID=75366 RepID=A0A672KRJ4_SINGR